MVGKIALIKNLDEIEKAKDMGLNPPKEEYSYHDYYFHMEDLKGAYIGLSGLLFLVINGEELGFKNEPELYQ